MPTNVRVVHSWDFVRATADGRVDFDSARNMLRTLAAAAAPLDDCEMLIDIRDAVGHLTPDEIQRLAATLAEFQRTFTRKTAILCPRERFESSFLFSTLAAHHGFGRIRAFIAYEDAMEWLIAS
jgi:hypothetical protein